MANQNASPYAFLMHVPQSVNVPLVQCSPLDGNRGILTVSSANNTTTQILRTFAELPSEDHKIWSLRKRCAWLTCSEVDWELNCGSKYQTVGIFSSTSFRLSFNSRPVQLQTCLLISSPHQHNQSTEDSCSSISGRYVALLLRNKRILREYYKANGMI